MRAAQGRRASPACKHNPAGVRQAKSTNEHIPTQDLTVRCRCWMGGTSPGADVVGVSPVPVPISRGASTVPVKMWQGKGGGRYGTGEKSPGADVARGENSPGADVAGPGTAPMQMRLRHTEYAQRTHKCSTVPSVLEYSRVRSTPGDRWGNPAPTTVRVGGSAP